ncbi:hypothetical protein [Agromyces bauzanensis]
MIVLWDAKAQPGRADDLEAFVSVAVTPSRNDPGNIDKRPTSWRAALARS